MSSNRVTIDALRIKLSDPDAIEREGFAILSDICRLTAEADSEHDVQELVLRAMEQRDRFGKATRVLDGLLRHTGLFPYLSPEKLPAADQIAYEVHKPIDMADEVVFHRPQATIYRYLMQGESVALSAPTSFGKSLIIDAVIASKKYRNIVVVVPTVALIDETRRRLSSRFGAEFKIITHAIQKRSQRNIYVLTQERVLEFADLDDIDFFVIDEFYKLSPGSEDDDRCGLLNQAFYRLSRKAKQFYMLGPNILGLSEPFRSRVECRFIKESYHTVVSELHFVRSVGDTLNTLVELCRSLDEPTIVFCSSPKRAADVANAMVSARLGEGRDDLRPATEWVASHYHPEWHFTKALASGIGVHHGRVPRALAQYVVRQFNDGKLRFLICTSTLIEGVNTKAKNIVILDKKINGSDIDLFTFNNIRGRSGRMGQHFVGHVYVFHQPPKMGLPFVDVPAFSQSENAPESLLIQLSEDDLTPVSRGRLRRFSDQSLIEYETLKANVGIDLEAQLVVANRVVSAPPKVQSLLMWHGLPKYDELQAVCEIIWESFDGRRLGSGSVVSAKQLAFFINRLRNAPTVAALIDQTLEREADPDRAVQQVVDFVRLWATFHFPRLLRAVDRIQRDVFARLGRRSGNYEVFASRVESLFLDPTLLALDEYGVPLEVARKLQDDLRPNGDLDETLRALSSLRIERTSLNEFEKELVADAQRFI